MIGKVLINSAISCFAGIGHCGSRYLTTEPDMIKFLAMRIQACFNIPQALPVRKLGIGKAEKLIITRKPSDSAIALLFFNEFVKLIAWKMLQYLREDRFPGIHRQPSLPLLGRRYRSE